MVPGGVDGCDQGHLSCGNDEVTPCLDLKDGVTKLFLDINQEDSLKLGCQGSKSISVSAGKRSKIVKNSQSHRA